SIKFPSTLSEVGDHTFHNCINLREVELNEGLQKIGLYAFFDCKSLESIEFPSTLIEHGEYSFQYCIMLGEVALNEGLQEIEAGAFYNCKSLESINVPSTLSEFGNNAFNGCINLKNGCINLKVVVLNEGSQKIGQYAFFIVNHWRASSFLLPFPRLVMQNLREVMLNEGVQKIGHFAFHNCSSLESIKFPKISIRLKAITHAAQTEVENKINEIPGFLLRGGDISISVAAMSYPYVSIYTPLVALCNTVPLAADFWAYDTSNTSPQSIHFIIETQNNLFLPYPFQTSQLPYPSLQ
ncbi:hypothetical protein ACHAXR_002437, partial [Thalassiosira sp. AJA248-18]